MLASSHHGDIARKESRQPQVFAKRTDYVACDQRIDTVRSGYVHPAADMKRDTATPRRDSQSGPMAVFIAHNGQSLR